MPVSDQIFNSERYQLIPRVLVFVFRAGKVLLLKIEKPTSKWQGLLNGPGGHMEKGENPLLAARRELLEETGLYANLHLSGLLIVDTGKSPGIGLYIFSGEQTSGELASGSEGHAAWINLSEIDSLPAVEDVPILLKKIISLGVGDAPFVGRSFYDQSGKLNLLFEE